jgi:indole-3-glycerol phosphate synthase
MNKLIEICATTRQEVARRKTLRSLSDLDRAAATQTTPRGFHAALTAHAKTGYALIAEIKKASPSKGLTDAPYFQGHEDYLKAARAACDLPVLRKDFMVDPYQIAEARSIGADAILIIVAALDDAMMAELEAAALERGMDVLVEVHDSAELDRALRLKSRLIGVNNRDLRDFSVDFARTYELVGKAPADVTFVAESGLTSHADLTAMSDHGVRTFLVGESLMRQTDVESATRALLTGS